VLDLDEYICEKVLIECEDRENSNLSLFILEGRW